MLAFEDFDCVPKFVKVGGDVADQDKARSVLLLCTSFYEREERKSRALWSRL